MNFFSLGLIAVIFVADCTAFSDSYDDDDIPDTVDENCVDTNNGALDKAGDSCSDYSNNSSWCNVENDYGDEDFDFWTMCCVCGGGEIASTTEVECNCSGDLVAQSGDHFCQVEVEGYEQGLCKVKEEGEDCGDGEVVCVFIEHQFFTSYMFLVMNDTGVENQQAWLQNCTETVSLLFPGVSCDAVEEADFDDTDNVWMVTLKSESESEAHAVEEYYLEEGTISVNGATREVIEEEEDDGNISVIVTLTMFFVLCTAITLFFCCGKYPDNSKSSGDESYSEADDEYVKSDVFRMEADLGSRGRKSTQL